MARRRNETGMARLWTSAGPDCRIMNGGPWMPRGDDMNSYLKAAIWIVIVLAVAVGIGWFFFEPAEVPDQAMAPTVWAGDEVLVLRRGKIERGDVAVCEHPEFPGQVVMGRVFALPGDTIEISRGVVRVNDDEIFEEADGPFLYMDRTSSEEAFEFQLTKKKQIVGGIIAYLLYDKQPRLGNVAKTKVESGFYLLADNRAGGLDSRTYGEVHESLCRGRAFFVYKAEKGLGDADNERRLFTFINE